jgi:hypothetical protein
MAAINKVHTRIDQARVRLLAILGQLAKDLHTRAEHACLPSAPFDT